MTNPKMDLTKNVSMFFAAHHVFSPPSFFHLATLNVRGFLTFFIYLPLDSPSATSHTANDSDKIPACKYILSTNASYTCWLDSFSMVGSVLTVLFLFASTLFFSFHPWPSYHTTANELFFYMKQYGFRVVCIILVTLAPFNCIIT